MRDELTTSAFNKDAFSMYGILFAEIKNQVRLINIRLKTPSDKSTEVRDELTPSASNNDDAPTKPKLLPMRGD